MEAEINEVIARNLPAHVGDVLRKRLEQADKDAKELESLSALYAHVNKQNLELRSEVSKLQADMAKHATLDAREKAVLARENALELEIMKMRAINAESNKQDLYALVGTIFKSPVVKESVFEGSTRNVFAPGSSYPSPVSDTATRSVVREVE